jgi:hypothetical protein
LGGNAKTAHVTGQISTVSIAMSDVVAPPVVTSNRICGARGVWSHKTMDSVRLTRGGSL